MEAIQRVILFSPLISQLGKSRLRLNIKRQLRCSNIGGPTSSHVIDEEFADLELKPMYSASDAGHVRIRQHVNPFKSSLSKPVEPPDWKEVFGDSTLPLMVDIGCGGGRFLVWLAKNSPQPRNYLGLEIRQKLVSRSQCWARELDLKNIHFMFANVMVSFEQIISTYPGPLSLVTILCPDPHFKRRNHKRRVVQKPLVDSISKNLSLGGQVLVQSDVFEVALDMRNAFDACENVFEHIDRIDPTYSCDSEGWLLNNPLGIRTEREIHAQFEGATIYRRLYQKVTQSS